MKDWIEGYLEYESDYLDSKNEQKIQQTYHKGRSDGYRSGQQVSSENFNYLLNHIWDKERGELNKRSEQIYMNLYEEMLAQFVRQAVEQFNDKVRPLLNAGQGGMGQGIVYGLHSPSIQVRQFHADFKRQSAFYCVSPKEME